MIFARNLSPGRVWPGRGANGSPGLTRGFWRVSHSKARAFCGGRSGRPSAVSLGTNSVSLTLTSTMRFSGPAGRRAAPLSRTGPPRSRFFSWSHFKGTRRAGQARLRPFRRGFGVGGPGLAGRGRGLRNEQGEDVVAESYPALELEVPELGLDLEVVAGGGEAPRLEKGPLAGAPERVPLLEGPGGGGEGEVCGGGT